MRKIIISLGIFYIFSFQLPPLHLIHALLPDNAMCDKDEECASGACVKYTLPGEGKIRNTEKRCGPIEDKEAKKVINPDGTKTDLEDEKKVKQEPLRNSPCKQVGGKDNAYFNCDTGLGITISSNPKDFVKTLFGVILSISGMIALLLIIFSGYRLITSRGNPEKITDAKDRLTSAVIGLLFVIFSLVILQIIGVDILHIPGLTE
ncbi:MAG: pilin [Candidatus Levyibacteriota bacterium]